MSPDFIKVGAAPTGNDMTQLRETFGVDLDAAARTHFYDIQQEIFKAKPEAMPKRKGEILSFKRVCAELNLHPLKDKGGGSWLRDYLSPEQIKYAVEDAWFSLYAYARIEDLHLSATDSREHADSGINALLDALSQNLATP